MKIAGIVAEYNPFHNGHLYHINKTREITGADYVIAVMSGNFVQRGMPAAFDKYQRTKMALSSGVDMVIELPVYYACSSAEYFAWASVQLFNACGIINSICFGSESGDLPMLSKAADFFLNETSHFKNTLKDKMALGLSYPAARKIAFHEDFGENSDFLDTPNNILSVEYLKALKKTNSKIKPYTLHRIVSPYHSIDLEHPVASATAIRKGLNDKEIDAIKKNVPKNIFNIIEENYLNYKITDLNNLSTVFHYILRTLNKEELSQFLDVDEGLENRILNSAGQYFFLSDILKSLKCKRYTMTKLQRAVIHIILGINKEDFTTFNDLGGPGYIRILGFRRSSSIIFKDLEKYASLPLVTNLAKDIEKLNESYQKMLKKEIISTDLFNLSMSSSSGALKNKNYEYRTPMVII